MASKKVMASEKLCIVVSPVLEAKYHYYIYMVDVSEHGEAERPEKASVRIGRDAPFGMAFTVYESTLFMFGGVANNSLQKKAFTYRLRFGSCTTIEPFEAGTQAITPMFSPKCEPLAVTLDGKICVFSSKIQRGALNFELYNPEINEWFPMPNPPIITFSLVIDVIHYYTVGSQLVIRVVDKNVLFLHGRNTTFKSWAYSFDTGSFEWRSYDFPSLSERIGCPSSCVEDCGLLISPKLEIFDTETKPEGRLAWEFFELCGKGEIEFYGVQRAIVGLRNKKKKERLRVCVVRAGGPPISISHSPIPIPLLAIDLVLVGAEATLTVLRSHVFHLDPTIYTCENRILGVFPM